MEVASTLGNQVVHFLFFLIGSNLVMTYLCNHLYQLITIVIVQTLYMELWCSVSYLEERQESETHSWSNIYHVIAGDKAPRESVYIYVFVINVLQFLAVFQSFRLN